jgi:hypothetical protein
VVAWSSPVGDEVRFGTGGKSSTGANHPATLGRFGSDEVGKRRQVAGMPLHDPRCEPVAEVDRSQGQSSAGDWPTIS